MSFDQYGYSLPCSSRLSSRSSVPSLQGVPGIVRTAKAERRLKEKMIQEGLISDDDEESNLTPAEQRTLRAEKRAAWRQARLKSLEQDALQAQMVIKKMSEMMDNSSKSEGIAVTQIDSPTEPEKPSEVETLREKIISLELSNADEDVDNGKMETGASDAESESEDITGQESSINAAVESSDSLICTSPTTENAPNLEKMGMNNSKKKKRKRSKKGRN